MKWSCWPHLWQMDEDYLGVLCFYETYIGFSSLGLTLGCLGGGRCLKPFGDRRGASERWTSGG
jgi:hypothetical protein